MKNKLGFKLIGLVALSLLLAVSCAEKGTDPDANLPPDTFITGFQVELAPDSATHYNAKIYWTGSDVDGAVYWYYWRIIDGTDSMFIYTDDGDTLNISTWQETSNLNVELTLNFEVFDHTYIFEVRSQDNDRDFDATPAVDTIGINRIRDFNYAPDTRIITGPPDGALTSEGVLFVIAGDDIDGVTDSMDYKVDDADWVRVATDINTGILTSNITGLSVGSHTVSYRAVDNFGKIDPTPVTRSVVVQAGFAPELSVSVSDGEAFIVPYTDPVISEFTITWQAIVAFYYGAIDSFVVITSEGDTLNTTSIELTFTDLGSGDYWIDVTAYDIAGNSTPSGQIDFSVVELAANNGLLCVNGVSWGSYGSEAVNLWNNGVAWGNRAHFKCWDLFTDAFTSATVFNDSLLGTTSIPSWMMDTLFFDAIVWMYNSYDGDNDFWEDETTQEALMNYLDMGGNFLITGRYAHFIFEHDNVEAFSEYCQYSSSVSGLNPTSAVAVHDSVSDMGRIGSLSYTEVVSVGHPDAIQLFETNDGDAGLGWIILPNGAGGGGAVSFIGGRSYRWDPDDLKGNIDVILRYWFGVAE